MDLSKLFETQAALDARIYESHPELKGQDNLDWKVLALQVELGECANEWRGFKRWSHDQEPRTCVSIGDCRNCGGTGNAFGVPEEAGIGCWECGGIGEITKNPLLEEYVDCLHFILSIGLELELDCRYNSLIREENIVEEGEPTLYLFAEVLSFASELFWGCYHDGYEEQEGNYKALFTNFIQLGKSLGFTWGQIEQAYYAKNQVNHQRQESGY